MLTAQLLMPMPWESRCGAFFCQSEIGELLKASSPSSLSLKAAGVCWTTDLGGPHHVAVRLAGVKVAYNAEKPWRQ